MVGKGIPVTRQGWGLVIPKVTTDYPTHPMMYARGDHGVKFRKHYLMETTSNNSIAKYINFDLALSSSRYVTVLIYPLSGLKT